MALPKKKKSAATTTVSPSTVQQVNSLDIQIRSVDRSAKDISTWRDALKGAESVYSPMRYRLYDVYADVLLDGHLTGVINKRIDAVLNKIWHYLGKDAKKVDEMDDTIESSVFRRIIANIIWREFWGVKGMEFLPGPELAFQEIPIKHIRPELGLITVEQTGSTGIAYAEIPNVWVLDGGSKYDLGILLKCAPYAIYKKGNVADWAQYIEIFGQPVRVMYYDLHDREGKRALQKTLDESGSSLAMMLPKGVEFDLKDGKQSNGDGQLQNTFKDALNAEMSILVLGNTETTTGGKNGSLAKSKVHQTQQLEVTKSDLALVSNALNSPKFFAILKSYGLPVQEGGKFTTAKELDMEVLADRVQIDIQVAQQVPVGDDYWYDTYGIPKPDNYDELKAKQETMPKAPAKGKKPDQEEEDAENLFAEVGKSSLKQWFKDFFVRARS